MKNLIFRSFALLCAAVALVSSGCTSSESEEPTIKDEKPTIPNKLTYIELSRSEQTIINSDNEF